MELHSSAYKDPHCLYCVEGCCFYPNWLKPFTTKVMLNFSKHLFCIYLNDHIVFVLHYADVIYYMYMYKLNQSSILWISPI